jgi:hypothetical protein
MEKLVSEASCHIKVSGTRSSGRCRSWGMRLLPEHPPFSKPFPGSHAAIIMPEREEE